MVKTILAFILLNALILGGYYYLTKKESETFKQLSSCEAQLSVCAPVYNAMMRQQQAINQNQSQPIEEKK